MKVSELITLLKAVDPDDEVFVWVDGERHAVGDVDPIGYWYTDINVVKQTGEVK